MEKYTVPEVVVDKVSAAIHGRELTTSDSVVDRLISLGVSVTDANRVKNVVFPPPSNGGLSSPGSQAVTALSSPLVMCRWEAF
jgi:hypothetical protein